MDAALHTLLGLIPYPDDPEERELLEDALTCYEAKAPDVARLLAERMRAHYGAKGPAAQGGQSDASAGVV